MGFIVFDLDNLRSLTSSIRCKREKLANTFQPCPNLLQVRIGSSQIIALKNNQIIVLKKHCKTCLKRPLQIDKTNALKTDGSLMQVDSIADCSIGAFCNMFDLY